jgi:hypothetical protein
MIEYVHFSATGMTDKLNSIPLISPAALKKLQQISQSEQRTEIMHARVTGSHQVSQLINAQTQGQNENQTVNLKYQLLLQIGQQQLKTLSNQNWPVGSELKVQLQPDQSLKVLGLINTHINAQTSTDSNQAITQQRLSGLMTQLLANRLPISENLSTQKIVNGLNLLLQHASMQSEPKSTSSSPTNTLTNNSPLNPANNDGKTALLQTLKSWRENLPSSQSITSSQNASSQSTSGQTTQAQSKVLNSSGLSLNPQSSGSNPSIQASSSQALSSTPATEGAQQIKQLLNNSGIFAESKLVQAMHIKQAPTNSNNTSGSSINDRFQSLQHSLQQAIASFAKVGKGGNNQPANASSPAANIQQAIQNTVSVLQGSTQTAAGFGTGTGNTAENKQQAVLQALQSLFASDQKLNLGKILTTSMAEIADKPATNNLPLIITPAPAMAEGSAANSPDLQIIRLLQTLFSQIEREQFSQLQNLNSPGTATEQNNVQWFPLLLNHNAQIHNVDLFLERQATAEEDNQKSQQWHINLHFELENLGQLALELTMVEQQCQARFWSEQQDTLQMLSQHIQPLRARLSEAGIQVNELEVRHGTLPRKSKTISQQLVDIRT